VQRPNPYEASVVKRTDGCIAGAGWPSVKHLVSHLCQAFVADLISVAGHSLGLHQTPIEGQCFCGQCSTGNSSTCKCYALETLLCPHAGPLNASGLCRETLLVSVELGGGAATGPLVTDHQADERERRSNQNLGLGAFRPDVPSQSVLYLARRNIA
jgi:hypothetical protein